MQNYERFIRSVRPMAKLIKGADVEVEAQPEAELVPVPKPEPRATDEYIRKMTFSPYDYQSCELKTKEYHPKETGEYLLH
jgi:hypothetical protein